MTKLTILNAEAIKKETGDVVANEYSARAKEARDLIEAFKAERLAAGLPFDGVALMEWVMKLEAKKALGEVIKANPEMVEKVKGEPSLTGWFFDQVMEGWWGKHMDRETLASVVQAEFAEAPANPA